MSWESDKKRGGTPFLASLMCLTGLVALAPAATGGAFSPGADVAKPGSGTLGFVITGWTYGMVETPTLSECTRGAQPGEQDQMRAMKNGEDQRRTSVGGNYETRGPKFESGNLVPLTFEDPLPFSEYVSKENYGVNLDGTPDGRATAKTCKHDKFVSVGGDDYGASKGQMIDNQMARIVGCVTGYRNTGQMSAYYNNEITQSQINRHLINVTGVDSEVNDPHVDVTIYKGFDRVLRGGGDKWVPGLSHRIDQRFPQYVMHTTGKIVNGVLFTTPIPDARMPRSQERSIGDRLMKDMTFVLKLNPDGADGIIAGYENVEKWFGIHNKLVVSEVGKYTSPNIYRALLRYADGYPDKTGQCTHISATYKINAVRAVIVNPAQAPTTRLAQK